MAINLSSIKKTVRKSELAVIHGQHGIGKTTFLANAPAPIFAQTEEGQGILELNAFPLIKTFDDMMDAITALYKEDHKYQTFVVDSLDHFEPLVWAAVCKQHSVDHIERIPYAKGYTEALTLWQRFLNGCAALRDNKGMRVWMTAHTEIKRFEAPDSEPYDRYQIALHRRASALVQETADIVAFANYRTVTQKTDVGFNKKITRGVSTGERLLFLEGRPAYDAKNRYNLPDHLPLEWEAFSAAMTTNKGE